MNGRQLTTAAGAGLLALLLGACSYHYLQHSDRIGFRSGDAVRANLERETDDPSHRLVYDTKGLGKNGSVQPVAADSKKANAAAGNCAPAGTGSSPSSGSCAAGP